ncbi:ribonuclease H-like domain-containing protein [Tanacetum coccineum]
MVTVRCLISIVVVNGWPLYQLDVNNVFLYGDLVEDVYMTLPEGYNNLDKSKVCKLNKSLNGLNQAPRQWNAKLPAVLAEHGFEQSKFDYSLYVKHKGKQIYLTNTRPDIIYPTHCLSQHMHSPLQSHFKAALRVLRYLKGFPGCRIQFYKKSDLKLKAYTDADWAKCLKIKKSITGSMSSASCEIVWLGNLLHSLGSKNLYPVEFCCDYSSAIQIAANPVFHERTNHFELDVYFVTEKVLAGVIKIESGNA